MGTLLLHNLDRLLLQSKQVLLLQGPNGGFFTKFSAWLSEHGKTVFKINLNAGDEHFYPLSIPHTHAYQDELNRFDQYLDSFIQHHRIDTIVCFGDNRPYHLIAKQICTAKQINFYAFEEGYFRPNYVTLEQGGVNAFSPLPRNADFFIEKLNTLPAPKHANVFRSKITFWKMFIVSLTYYCYIQFNYRSYPYYTHHRESLLSYYIGLWIKSGWIKLTRKLPEKQFAKAVESGAYGRFFILPLQVFCDSQVKVHSDFSSVASFLLHVLTSFANHAPDNTQLIVKHHPMDRGFVSYHRIFKRFFARHPDLKKRIHYVYDVPLPILMRKAAGMVTLNSTAGLSALIHGLPVKVLGRANYDIPEITDQQPLATFWRTPAKPNTQAFHAFRQFHLNVTQISGSFYNRVDLPK